MRKLSITAFALTIGAIAAIPAFADQLCTTRAVAGSWVFATGVGHQMLGDPFPPGKDITAIGTMNIDKFGNVSGTFDATVQDFAALADIPYTGSVEVNADCTGTLQFVTGTGTARTDSIGVVGRNEILGMSQDPNNLWTYQVRRVGNRPQ